MFIFKSIYIPIANVDYKSIHDLEYFKNKFVPSLSKNISKLTINL